MFFPKDGIVESNKNTEALTEQIKNIKRFANDIDESHGTVSNAMTHLILVDVINRLNFIINALVKEVKEETKILLPK